MFPRQRFTDLNHQPLHVQLGSYESKFLGWGFFEPEWWRNYLHTHSFFEICYAFHGVGTFRMLGHDYTVRAGDLFVAKPNEPHEIISSEDEPLGIYFWSYTLVPSLPRTSESNAVDELLDRFSTSETWVSDRAPSLLYTLELLTEEIVQRQPGYTQALTGLAQKLLLDTARAIVEPQPPATLVRSHQGTPPTVQQIIQYLHDNYQRSLNIRDLAAQVNLSERHISRIFTQTIGKSIIDYLTDIRIKAAAQMLIGSNIPIKAIAEANGYPDVQHFTTLFRRRVGRTPAAFRREGGTMFL